MEEYKACTKCGQTKSLELYARDKYKKSGFTSQCLECRASYAKAKKESDPDYRLALLERGKRDYHSDKPRRLALYKQWASNNKEKRRASNNAWAANNRPKLAAKMVEYRKNNPDVRKEWGHRNPDKQAALYAKRSFRRRGGRSYLITLKELAALYKSPCLYCGSPSQHIDHIVPLSRGGEHRIGNLTGSCAPCNLSKGAKFITEWKKGKNAS